MSNCRDKKRQSGYTLIELIVVIAIMATLVGVVAPQFIKYVTKNRQTACETNREAILKVFEKCAYEGCVNIDTAGLNDLLAGTLVAVPAYYKGEVADHNNCTVVGNGNSNPFSGTVVQDPVTGVYTVTLSCTCEQHESKPIQVDFVGWAKAADEDFGDPGLPSPPPEPGTHVTPGVDPDPDPTPGVTKTPRPSTWWPYLDDPRWDGKRWPGQKVNVDAGVCFREDGVKYAVIDKNNNGKWTGKGVFEIEYTWSAGPGYIDTESDNWYWIIQLSGMEYEEKDLHFTNDKHETTVSPIARGDIYVQNGYVFVFIGTWNTGETNYINMPTYNGSGVPDNKYNEWYCVGTYNDYKMI